MSEERFGAVLFDSPDSLDGGWYYLDEPRRFSRISELPIGAGHVYWTNMDTGVLRLLSTSQAHLRDHAYFRAGLNFVLPEFGISARKNFIENGGGYALRGGHIVEPVNDEDRRFAVGLMARLMRLVLDRAGYDASSSSSLRRALRDAPWAPPADMIPSADGRAHWTGLLRTEDSLEPYGRPVQANFKPADRPAVRFQRNRLLHALEVAAVPVPANRPDWRSMEGAEIAGAEGVINSTKPVLARAVITKQPEDLARLYGIGVGARRAREYFAHPEFLVLHELGFRFRVEQVWVAEAYEDSGIKYPDVPLGPLAFSIGLYAENLWKSRGLFRRAGKRPISAEPVLSPAGVWIASQDRISSFLFALRLLRALHEHPDLFEVDLAGFGMGHAMLYMPPAPLCEDTTAWVYEVAAVLQAVPIGLGAPEESKLRLPSDSADDTTVKLWAASSGIRSVMSTFDWAATKPAQEQTALLRKLEGGLRELGGAFIAKALEFNLLNNGVAGATKVPA